MTNLIYLPLSTEELDALVSYLADHGVVGVQAERALESGAQKLRLGLAAAQAGTWFAPAGDS